MEVVETEFEILRISKSVSLPFEGLDFVYETLDGPAGDAMLEVVEKSSPVGPEGLAHSFERLDSGVAWRPCTIKQEDFIFFQCAARNPVDCFSRFLDP